jgi:hypothetical protein
MSPRPEGEPDLEREAHSDARVRLVTVASYFNHSDALMARMRLESSGIDCHLADEHLNRVHWGLAPAIGGIKLQVREEDAEAAAEILHENPGMPYVVEEDEQSKE